MNPLWGKVDLPETFVPRGKKDENSYIIAIIERIHHQSTETYETLVRIVKYRLEAYVSLKENFKRAGLKNMFILHDPTIFKAEEKLTKELNINKAVELIKTAKNIEELADMVENDIRKGVIDAIAKKIEELKGE
jgi:hypothetical protein